MKRLFWFGLVVVLILAGNAVNNNLKDYWQDVLQQCGIAVIMAVSLNIVNGLTGQFAIGHAGFMAVGAYTGASVTYFAIARVTCIRRRWGRAGCCWRCWRWRTAGRQSSAILSASRALGRCGDYLAIVTLGFWGDYPGPC